MKANDGANPTRISAHVEGALLRLETPATYATDLAAKILGFLQAELEAEIPTDGWQPDYKLKVTEAVAIQLEGLQVQLSTDGNEIELRCVGGSEAEFEDLCELVIAECLHE